MGDLNLIFITSGTVYTIFESPPFRLTLFILMQALSFSFYDAVLLEYNF